MKAFILGLIVLCSFSALAQTPKLYSADICMRAMMLCEQPAKMVNTANSECGCLTKEDYIPQKTCMVARIACPRVAGVEFRSVKAGKRTLGCGCFEIVDSL